MLGILLNISPAACEVCLEGAFWDLGCYPTEQGRRLTAMSEPNSVKQIEH